MRQIWLVLGFLGLLLLIGHGWRGEPLGAAIPAGRAPSVTGPGAVTSR